MLARDSIGTASPGAPSSCFSAQELRLLLLLLLVLLQVLLPLKHLVLQGCTGRPSQRPPCRVAEGPREQDNTGGPLSLPLLMR